MSEKILIIGQGFLGNAIFSVALGAGIHVIATRYSEQNTRVDVCDTNSIEKVVHDTKPDAIINCAALTNIDQIESNPKNAYAINAYGAKNVAKIAFKNKIKLVHLSTDSVFDGIKGMYDEEDLPNPINEYAKSKKLGEDFVRDVSDKFVIVRTNFYGYHEEGKFLFNWILENLRLKQSITAFYDVIFNPLEVRNLATILIELVKIDFSGTIHLASNEIMSKYEFAVKIADTLNFDRNLIKKGSLNDAHFVAKRPLDTSLSNFKAKKIIKTEPLTLQSWLKNHFS